MTRKYRIFRCGNIYRVKTSYLGILWMWAGTDTDFACEFRSLTEAEQFIIQEQKQKVWIRIS